MLMRGRVNLLLTTQPPRVNPEPNKLKIRMGTTGVGIALAGTWEIVGLAMGGGFVHMAATSTGPGAQGPSGATILFSFIMVHTMTVMMARAPAHDRRTILLTK